MEMRTVAAQQGSLALAQALEPVSSARTPWAAALTSPPGVYPGKRAVVTASLLSRMLSCSGTEECVPASPASAHFDTQQMGAA
jgi:hypothetical protein